MRKAEAINKHEVRNLIKKQIYRHMQAILQYEKILYTMDMNTSMMKKQEKQKHKQKLKFLFQKAKEWKK